MKRNLILLFLCLITLIWSCQETDDFRYTALGGSRYSSTTIPRQTYNADSFFWGTWISMADGKSYSMQEKKAVVGDKIYWYKSGTSGDTLVAADLGTFVKQSDSVIINNNIPYFRQGGANLEYKVKIVGFSDGRSEATAIPLKNRKIKTTSQTYENFSKNNDATTDQSGDVKLIAPTVNDVQTITVFPEEEDGRDSCVVVPGVKIETNESNVGTIAVVKEGDYSLKVYGNVTNKDDGYMYVRNDKWYQMSLIIKNISDVVAGSSYATISTDDKKHLSIRAKSDKDNLDDVAISQMNPGAEKQVVVEVQYDYIEDGYVDTLIKVTITNPGELEGPEDDKVWEDYIPLRFYKGQFDFTIAASATEHNPDAVLHGFIIYPDKNNQFFTVGHESHKTITVPSFKKDEDYLLVFSGATVEGDLSKSTEMFYTVQEGNSAMTVQRAGKNMNFGGTNYTEDAAYSVGNNPFEAYLSANNRKYFKIRGSDPKAFVR